MPERNSTVILFLPKVKDFSVFHRLHGIWYAILCNDVLNRPNLFLMLYSIKPIAKNKRENKKNIIQLYNFRKEMAK